IVSRVHSSHNQIQNLQSAHSPHSSATTDTSGIAMTNGNSTHDNADGSNAGQHRAGNDSTAQQSPQNYTQRPTPPPPVPAYSYYPNYGYNAQNPPTNLWGPPAGADIAAMAVSSAVPANVVITKNNYSDTGSLASTISMPHSSGSLMAAAGINNPMPLVTSAAPSIPNNNKPPLQHEIQQQQFQQQQIQLQQQQHNIQPNQNRAIHRINLSSIRHNYNEVQSSAAQQQCQVIVVVKADGYGHGAILTACHLVEHCGASAFAVATIEEGISLRRAFEEKFPILSTRVRILVLGAPVGYPNCFDSYLHNNIELMLSGPEVASSLAQWMKNHDGRRRAEVERVAERRKEELMDEAVLGDYRNPMRNGVVRQISVNRGEANEELLKGTEKSANAPSKNECCNDGNDVSTCNTTITSNGASFVEDHTSHATPRTNAAAEEAPVSPSRLQKKYNAATLTNVTGDDLAREVRQILIGQRHATAKATQAVAEGNIMATIPEPPAEETSAHDVSRKGSGVSLKTEEKKLDSTPQSAPPVMTPTIPAKKVEGETLFCGIEDAARASRQRELRAIRQSQKSDGDHTAESVTSVTVGEPQIRKKLRWHALVDSGMGRLGFKTEVDERERGEHAGAEDGMSDGSLSSSDSGIRDTVSIIKELYDAEVHEGAPIEFYGMCTHMAEASATSTYTHDQMERFRSLLHRVRSAGIAVPSISTDNSAALLTTSLTHFDPDAILAHDTRGYVRCGGAIYGQRPTFRQLRAVSTLSATVKHVAIIKQGESVGYDRAYVAPLDVRIATLTVGFADGYPRELGNGVGRVSIRGSTFPVAGNVCMDMLMVELGQVDDSAGVGSTVAVGDIAVLWGPEETNVQECGDGLVPLAQLASTLKTTQSALTCGLDKLRVQRQLVG
ncbi:hypothetical protein ACHAXR_005930, partial [Thalassiosira sp. AJA248-18]